MLENAELDRKVNFARCKIPLEPAKMYYSVPAQEATKHHAAFGGIG